MSSVLNAVAARNTGAPADATRADAHRLLSEAIEHAAHLLPGQGPITVFIHHNTLHAFEELTFTDALRKAAEVFGCEPYLSEERFRQELQRGRIRFADLQSALQQDLGPRGDERVLGLTTRLELRRAMLQYPMRHGPREELLWFVAETDALRKIRGDLSAAARGCLIAETRRWVMRDLRAQRDPARNGDLPRKPPEKRVSASLLELLSRFGEAHIESWNDATWEKFTLQALWRICCDGLTEVPAFRPTDPTPVRPRDLLLRATGEDSDLLVQEVLVPFCAAFLDQGMARWQLPDREAGFFRCFSALYRPPAGSPEHWLRALARELVRLNEANVSPLESIHESLAALGIQTQERDSFLSATLLALPGWAGMVQQVEIRGDAVRQPIAAGSLIEYLAVELLLERFALAHLAEEMLGYAGPLHGLRDAALTRIGKPASLSVEQRAFLVFQLALVMGWTPAVLYELDAADWTTLVAEVETFSPIERRRVFQLAYEHRFVTQSLDAIALHSRQVARQDRPRFQACFCLDEREESMRRHLEEVAPDVETFGAAGFFGVAMYYRGAADAHFVPMCPIVIRPQHWVREEVVDDLADAHARRARARRALGTLSHRIHIGSRTFAAGALLTAGLGMLASIPLVARITLPRLAARIRRRLSHLVQAPQTTRLQVERSAPEPGPGKGHIGYSVEEMTDIAERQLRDIGVTRNFARLIFLFGHGSSSLNNPHRSAYDCGACGGSPGAPSGRALAQILNDRRVRDRLAARGLAIPDDTVFIGGFHNTCNDTIRLFDLPGIPASHQAELEAVQRDLDLALKRNAHERCRRFESASLTLSLDKAHEHVEERSEDLAQTRPELGHATNALCIVGRRERTRGLFLDRRAFLTTYDPTQDADGSILTRLLQAAVPVCSGINLEYYFSRVDNEGFGCGTKLPHNVAALLGVMNGAASDLRTGLPWQMVEIHEPVRLLFIIETIPEILFLIMERNPGIGRIFRHGWCLLALQDPDTGAIQMFRDGVFTPYQPEADVLPHAASSEDWYRGWRDHLEFAEITGNDAEHHRSVANTH